MEITRLVESAQYVTNYHGQQTAVMLPIDVWDRLLEVLQNGEEHTEGIEDRIIEDDGVPSMAEIVARIKATPPNPAVKFATGSVDDLTPSDPDAEFDLEAWERDWGAAMEEVRRTNYIVYRNKGRMLTVQEAANILNIPFHSMMSLLDQGQMPFTETDGEKLIYYQEVYSYKHKRDQQRKVALDEMAELSQFSGEYNPDEGGTTQEPLDAVQRLTTLFDDVRITNLEEVLHAPMLELANTESTQSVESDQEEPWEGFVQSNYGVFRDDPLERSDQGTFGNAKQE